MKALFGEVDAAVTRALSERHSKLDALEPEEWTVELMFEDSHNINKTIEHTCLAFGWDVNDYNSIVRRLRDNRHHAY